MKVHLPTKDIFKEPMPLMVAYRKACESALRPYPSVLETLVRLKDRGCLIIAFTGSRAYYAAQRVKILGLDGIFDYVYSPQDHNPPPGITQEETFHSAAETYILQQSIQRPLATGMGKPDPEALLAIIKHVDAQIDQVVYVGDSLTRDIVMAQHAHVTDVYAEYGRVQPTPAYEFLRRFSHWTGEDFKRERAFNKRNEIYPTYVLKHSFGELMTHFDFIPYSRR
jgi:phosphoglycolate phosphatase